MYYYRDRVNQSLLDSGTHILPPVPAAFYDVRSNIRFINEGLLVYPGVFIATHSLSGWETLMNVWSRQAGTQWKTITSERISRLGIWVIKIAIDKGLLLSYDYQNYNRAYPDIYIGNDDYIPNPTIDFNLQKALIKKIMSINENGHPDPWEKGFAIISTPDVCKRLARLDSPLSDLPLVTVPEIQVRDIVPMLLAIKPKIEDMRSSLEPKSICLAEIFSILELLEKNEELLFKETIYKRHKYGLESAGVITWSNKDDVLELFRNGRLNEMHSQRQGKGSLDKWRSFFRRVSRIKSKNLPNFITKQGFMPIIDQYVGPMRRFKEILKMEKRLDNICS